MSHVKTLTASALALAALARVTSTSHLRVGAKYTVRFGVDGIARLVKLQPKSS